MIPIAGIRAEEKRERDQTDYWWPVMWAYLQTLIAVLGTAVGPLHISFDGLMADVMGEINSYWATLPARPWAGIRERSGWLPCQERHTCRTV